jgi:hypothetical protein
MDALPCWSIDETLTRNQAYHRTLQFDKLQKWQGFCWRGTARKLLSNCAGAGAVHVRIRAGSVAGLRRACAFPANVAQIENSSAG